MNEPFNEFVCEFPRPRANTCPSGNMQRPRLSELINRPGNCDSALRVPSPPEAFRDLRLDFAKCSKTSDTDVKDDWDCVASAGQDAASFLDNLEEAMDAVEAVDVFRSAEVTSTNLNSPHPSTPSQSCSSTSGMSNAAFQASGSAAGLCMSPSSSQDPDCLTANKKKRRNPWGSETYAELISKAIEARPDRRATLQQIYKFIIGYNKYFRDRSEGSLSAGWKNSIRHNLSLQAKFIKVGKTVENSKSSYWTIDDHAAEKKTYLRRRCVTLDKQSEAVARRKLIQRREMLSEEKQKEIQFKVAAAKRLAAESTGLASGLSVSTSAISNAGLVQGNNSLTMSALSMLHCGQSLGYDRLRTEGETSGSADCLTFGSMAASPYVHPNSKMTSYPAPQSNPFDPQHAMECEAGGGEMDLTDDDFKNAQLELALLVAECCYLNKDDDATENTTDVGDSGQSLMQSVKSVSEAQSSTTAKLIKECVQSTNEMEGFSPDQMVQQSHSFSSSPQQPSQTQESPQGQLQSFLTQSQQPTQSSATMQPPQTQGSSQRQLQSFLTQPQQSPQTQESPQSQLQSFLTQSQQPTQSSATMQPPQTQGSSQSQLQSFLTQPQQPTQSSASMQPPRTQGSSQRQLQSFLTQPQQSTQTPASMQSQTQGTSLNQPPAYLTQQMPQPPFVPLQGQMKEYSQQQTCSPAALQSFQQRPLHGSQMSALGQQRSQSLHLPIQRVPHFHQQPVCQVPQSYQKLMSLSMNPKQFPMANAAPKFSFEDFLLDQKRQKDKQQSQSAGQSLIKHESVDVKEGTGAKDTNTGQLESVGPSRLSGLMPDSIDSWQSPKLGQQTLGSQGAPSDGSVIGQSSRLDTSTSSYTPGTSNISIGVNDFQGLREVRNQSTSSAYQVSSDSGVGTTSSRLLVTSTPSTSVQVSQRSASFSNPLHANDIVSIPFSVNTSTSSFQSENSCITSLSKFGPASSSLGDIPVCSKQVAWSSLVGQYSPQQYFGFRASTPSGHIGTTAQPTGLHPS